MTSVRRGGVWGGGGGVSEKWTKVDIGEGGGGCLTKLISTMKVWGKEKPK